MLVDLQKLMFLWNITITVDNHKIKIYGTSHTELTRLGLLDADAKMGGLPLVEKLISFFKKLLPL